MGKFGKERFDEGNEWRVDMKTFFEDCSDGRIVVVNPNDHFNFLDDFAYESDREIMNYDLFKVRKSDLIIVNFNDPKSIGSASEMAVAYDKAIPIIGLCEHGEEEELHPWLKCFCDRIFTDREELKIYTMNHYVGDE